MDTSLVVEVVVLGAVVWSLIAWVIVRERRGESGSVDGLAADLTGIGERLATMEASLGTRNELVVDSVRALDERMVGISRMFSNDRTRGGWAELSLQRVFELAGMVEGRDYRMQDTGANGRPDAVVLLPGDRKLVVDAKFPAARYAEAMAAGESVERDRLLGLHAADLEKEAKALVERGYLQDASGGFVVMYVPHEGMLAEASRVRPDFYDRLISMRVVPAGPATLTAVLGSAARVLVEARTIDEAREIIDGAKTLRDRLEVFAGHLAKVGRGLDSALKAYNQSVGSYTARVVPQAERLAEHVGAPAPTRLEPVDSAPRLMEGEQENRMSA